MKTGRYLLILVIVLLSLSPAAAAVIAQNEKEVQAIAEPILDTVLKGLNDGNYGLYTKYFDATMKNAMPEKNFKEVRGDILKKLGKYKSRSYLGFQSKDNFTVALWNGRFSKTGNDVMIKLVLSKRGDKVQVSGLWFQ